MSIAFDPESIYNAKNTQVWRAKVIGGWLVITTITRLHTSTTSSVFVADASWAWEVS